MIEMLSDYKHNKLNQIKVQKLSQKVLLLTKTLSADAENKVKTTTII